MELINQAPRSPLPTLTEAQPHAAGEASRTPLTWLVPDWLAPLPTCQVTVLEVTARSAGRPPGSTAYPAGPCGLGKASSAADMWTRGIARTRGKSPEFWVQIAWPEAATCPRPGTVGVLQGIGRGGALCKGPVEGLSLWGGGLVRARACWGLARRGGVCRPPLPLAPTPGPSGSQPTPGTLQCLDRVWK